MRAELAIEGARKLSLEQRGLAIITSSGTLVTLLFAIGAVTQGGAIRLHGSARIALLAALYAFILAAIAGIVANWPWNAWGFSVDGRAGLKDMAKEKYFRYSESIVDVKIAEKLVSQVQAYRKMNKWKARALMAGLTLEVIAISCVALVITLPLL